MVASTPHVQNNATTTSQSPVTSQEPKSPSTMINATTTTNHLNTQEQILYEIRQLNRIQAELASDPTLKPQTLWNLLLQTLGVTVGALFGVFGVLAWKAANQANDMASGANALSGQANSYASAASSYAFAANQLALAAYCDSQTNALCSEVQMAASSSLTSYASSYYGISGTSTPSASSTPSSVPGAGGTASSSVVGVACGVIVGAIVLLAAGWLQWKMYKKREERSRTIKELSTSYDRSVE